MGRGQGDREQSGALSRRARAELRYELENELREAAKRARSTQPILVSEEAIAFAAQLRASGEFCRKRKRWVLGHCPCGRNHRAV